MSTYSVVMPAAALAAARDLISVQLPLDRPGYVRYAGVYLGAAATTIGVISLNRASALGLGTQGAVQEWDPADTAWTVLAPAVRRTAFGSQGATTLQDTTQAWATDQWKGRLLTLTGGTGVGQTRIVTSNTSNTLTVSAWGTNPVTENTTYSIASNGCQVNLVTAGATITGQPLRRSGIHFGTTGYWSYADEGVGITRLWIPPSGIVVLRLEAISASTTLGAELVVEVT